ncbi:unnamed protein product [Somion occarium]|uniref:Uncharacterized protein n=1 Tax=Somion occarium TaxID=3059160 RepID=A0ABP1CNK4_9APHY
MPPRQQQLSRLFIPPSLNSQQPTVFAENAPMFSPSLPTAIQHGMHPTFPMPASNSLQTPMQTNFFPPQPPGAPGRPSMHRSHPSVAQLAAAGILPPQGMLGHPGVPMTPLPQNGFPAPMIPGQFQTFVPRSKRAPSVSTGGPPKAVLGGPQRKETVRNEEDGSASRPDWARNPLPIIELPDLPAVEPPELTTLEAYPSDAWRQYIPPTVDVFLPGKSAWDTMKRRIIEEKLEKLGVERGTGSIVPHVHAPHARAASISSPADPALLFFKLNKLQQSQNNSTLTSLSSSPQPPIHLTPSPGSSTGLPPRFQGRHGHSMSLAQPPSFQSPVYNPTVGFNPFGPNATLGSEQIQTRVSPGPRPDTIHAPQGRVPTSVSSLAPPPVLSRPESRPDFTRGFGLDTTEEEEEPPEEPVPVEVNSQEEQPTDADGNREDNDDFETERDGMSTVAQSRIHSRHVSKLSAALSLRSVGRNDSPTTLGMQEQNTEPEVYHLPPSRSPAGEFHLDESDPGDDAIGEWTGSEDLRTGAETSEDESIGEWSNPSDEERARQQRSERLARRASRRAEQLKRDLEMPRRLPNFPRPPSAPGFLAGEDDIISNPSEEERMHVESYLDMGTRPASNLSAFGRPLPQIPHSRSASAQYSHHDPALAHSREGSEHLNLGGLHPRPVAASNPTLAPRKETLNPLAKPFVFGASSFISQPPASAATAHIRTQSVGKPLNVAAPEFKPGGFTFQFQPSIPSVPVLPPAHRPLPNPPVIVSSERVTQGREKRQRRASASSLNAEEDMEVSDKERDETIDEERDAKDTIRSFKFPPTPNAPKPFRHSAPASPPTGPSDLTTDGSLNPAAKPFTFSGFTGSTLDVEKSHAHYAASEGAERNENSMADSTIKPTEPQAAEELPYPPAAKQKRAPIPLDFKHPISTTTVPAGLFKNLNNGDGDERTRRAVRSRLSSREFGGRSAHNSTHSLSDNNVLPISSRRSANTRNRLFTDPGFRDTSPEVEDVFSSRRRSSLPPRRRNSASSGSESYAAMDIARQIDLEQFEERLETLLDEKMQGLKRDLKELRAISSGQGLTASTEDMISEVVSLFRTQLQESAARGLEESQMDARGELDFEVIKGIIEQGNAEARALLHRELRESLSQLENGIDFKAFAESLSERTMHTVMSATAQISMRIQALEPSRSTLSSEREAIVLDVMAALTPHLASLRSEPIDYEGLTVQLSQAVKPHISQLIDLASDKRETAGLIVDKLVPLLPSLLLSTPNFDVDNIVGRLTTEVRKIVEPLDAHEIKEQVSDLVVERLDSRLAVRDKAFNADVISKKVTESINDLLAPLRDLKSAVNAIGQVQHSDKAPQALDLSAVRQDITALLSNLPEQLVAATNALGGAREEFAVSAKHLQKPDPSTETIASIDSTLSSVSEQQKTLIDQNQEFSEFCQDIIRHINALPETILEATKVLQNAHSDMLSRDTTQKDSEEIRRLMTNSAELQVQLAKARGAHGQVRVEKDMLNERLRLSENERDRLRTQLNEVQTLVTNKTAEAAAMEARNRELEEALVQALERIKSSDVVTQTSLERISSLEKVIQDLSNEKYQFMSKANALEQAVASANRERDTVVNDMAHLRRQQEELLSQQSQWDELRRVNESVQALAALVSQGENEEVKELRRVRDRFKVLEGEHAALQRRLKDQENRAANNERTALTARQSLTQAQQRAAEWERRANEYEQELQSAKERLDQTEEARSQLDTDYSLVKLQLEERDAEERLAKDRESKLRDQIAALEGQVARAQTDADQARKGATAPLQPKSSNVPSRPRQNGYVHSVPPVRPDSRASTVYIDSRAVTPTGQPNGTYTPSVRGETPSQPSVWDSIHAPAARRDNPVRLPVTPKPRKPFYRPHAPSPTPSTVSATPTLGEDGWWT